METIVAQNATIDPELAEKVDASGWVYHFRRRAEEAEQAAEKWYNEYQRQLHTNEITTYLLSHNRRMRALYYRIARRVEAELMQGVNDLADRAQVAEQERDGLQRQLATLEIRVQAQREALAAALACCDELQALADAHKAEADNLQSAFEIAHKRREQLYNDNCDLSSTVVDLNHINGLLTQRLGQMLDLFDGHDLLWEIRDEAGARAAREIVKSVRELVGKV